MRFAILYGVESMKKFAIIFIILFPCLVYASVIPDGDHYRTNDGKLWVRQAQGADRFLNVERVARTPAKVVSNNVLQYKSAAALGLYKTSTGELVKRSTFMNIGKTLGSGILAGLAIGGMYALGESYVDWLIAQGNEDILRKDVNGYLEIQKMEGSYSCPNHDTVLLLGNWPLAQAGVAQQFAIDYKSSREGPCGWSGWQQLGGACGNGLTWFGFAKTSTPCLGEHFYVVFGDPPQVPTWYPATAPDLSPLYDNAYDDNPDGWFEKLTDAVNWITPAFTNPDAAPNSNPNIDVPKIMTDLIPAIEPVTIDEMEETLEEPVPENQTTPDDLIEEDKAKDDQTINVNANIDLSPVTDKLSEISGKMGTDEAVPTEPEGLVVVPDKKSLTGVMGDFMDTLKELPIVDTLQGITIQCSGTSTLCLDLPSAFGGARCMSFASYQDSLNSIGSVALAIVTIMSFVWVFSGNRGV